MTKTETLQAGAETCTRAQVVEEATKLLDDAVEAADMSGAKACLDDTLNEAIAIQRKLFEERGVWVCVTIDAEGSVVFK